MSEIFNINWSLVGSIIVANIFTIIIVAILVGLFYLAVAIITAILDNI